jgi:hypothetical protein
MSPTPQPNVQSSYNLTNSNGSVCAVLKTKLQFNITYKNKTSGHNTTFVVTFGDKSVWNHTTLVTGHCGTGNGTIPPNATKLITTFIIAYNGTYNATFNYTLNVKTKKWEQSNVTLNYTTKYFPDVIKAGKFTLQD